MIAVYLSNKYIRAAVGENTGGKIRVSGVYEVKDERGCILNGTVVDRDEFLELVKELWEKNDLPKRGVRLVVDNNQFTTKVVETPVQKPKQMLEFVSREFADVERIEEPVYSYVSMPGQTEKKAKLESVFATMAPKSTIQNYKEMFSSLGITLESIESARQVALYLSAAISSLQGKTCVLQLVDGMTFISVLLHKGSYLYSSRGRIFSDAGTAEYGEEIARAVSNLLQFAKTQNVTEQIEEVCIGGISPVDMEFFKESVERADSGLPVRKLCLEKDIVFAETESGRDMSEFALAVGGLGRTSVKGSLLEQAERNPEKEAAKAKRKKIWIPVTAAGVILLGFAGWLGGSFLYKTAKLAEMQEYNQRKDVVDACEKYDGLSEQIKAANVLTGNGAKLEEQMSYYPKVDSETEKVVAACASGLVSAEISGYSSEDGVLTFATSADKVEQINEFVRLLSEQSIFADVDYTGYRQDSEGQWNVEVNCRMAERGERQNEAGSDGTR